MSIADWIFLFFIVVYAIFWLLPIGLIFLFPAPRSYFDKNPDRSISKKHQNIVVQLTEKLEALGFVKLGIKIEKRISLSPNIYTPKFLEFASEKDNSFFSLYIRGNKITYYFYTPFSSGQLVLTANQGFFPIMENDVFQSAISLEPIDLLSVHKKQIESLLLKGYTPYQEYTKETRLKATSQYYNCSTIRKRMRKTYALVFEFLFIMLLAFVAIFVSIKK